MNLEYPLIFFNKKSIMKLYPLDWIEIVYWNCAKYIFIWHSRYGRWLKIVKLFQCEQILMKGKCLLWNAEFVQDINTHFLQQFVGSEGSGVTFCQPILASMVLLYMIDYMVQITILLVSWANNLKWTVTDVIRHEDIISNRIGIHFTLRYCYGNNPSLSGMPVDCQLHYMCHLIYHIQ